MKIGNKSIYVITFVIMMIISIVILQRYISYSYVLNNDEYKIDCDGFYNDNGVFYAENTSPSMDIYFDDDYSAINLALNGENLSQISVILYYSSRNGYSEYVNIGTTASENGWVEIKVPKSVNGYGYAHLEFIAPSSSFSVERVDVYKRIYTLSGGVLLRSLIISLISLVMIYFYRKKELFEVDDEIKKYIYCLLCSTSLFFIYALFTRGGTFQTVLASDSYDPLGDFYHSIIDALSGNPYDSFSNYPPLALMIFKLFSLFFSYEFDGKVLSLGEVILHQSSIWSYILFIFITMVSICYLLSDFLKLSGIFQLLFHVFIFLSAPFIFAIDRGNIVLVSLLFTLLFVRFYESPNAIVRELAYISLGIAFAIKIYPAIFGILLLRRHKWFEAVRSAIYGLILFFVPFIYYGFSYSIKQWISGMTITTSFDYGMGYNISLQNILRIFFAIFDMGLNSAFYRIVLVIITVMLLLCAFFSKNEHVSVLAMCLMLFLIPSYSYYYTAVFIVIPFVYYLKELAEIKLKKEKIKWELLYAFILVPFAFPVISDLSTGYKFYVSFGTLLQYFAIVIMILLCIRNSISALPILKKEK